MINLKPRVSLSLLRTIELDFDEVGSYALFYLLGENIETAIHQFIAGRNVRVVFDRYLISTLTQKHGATVFVKVGTTSTRTGIAEEMDPFWLRAQELRSSIKKCSIGKFDAMDCASRAVYEHMTRNPADRCFMVMCAVDSYSSGLYTSPEIEGFTANFVKSQFGLDIVNDSKIFKPRDMSRWSTRTLPLAYPEQAG